MRYLDPGDARGSKLAVRPGEARIGKWRNSKRVKACAALRSRGVETVQADPESLANIGVCAKSDERTIAKYLDNPVPAELTDGRASGIVARFSGNDAFPGCPVLGQVLPEDGRKTLEYQLHYRTAVFAGRVFLTARLRSFWARCPEDRIVKKTYDHAVLVSPDGDEFGVRREAGTRQKWSFEYSQRACIEYLRRAGWKVRPVDSASKSNEDELPDYDE